jgi:hypothetical protein
MYWLPLNEMGYWGYSHFYATKKILDFHYERGDKILVHCHAGAYRSVKTVVWWLVSRGHTYSGACSIELGNEVVKESEYDVEVGNTPKNLRELYSRMKRFPTYGVQGLTHPGSEALIDKTSDVYSDYYRKHSLKCRLKAPWWTIKRKIRSIKDWWRRKRKGLVVVRLGPGHTAECEAKEVELVKQKHADLLARVAAAQAEEEKARAEELIDENP